MIEAMTAILMTAPMLGTHLPTLSVRTLTAIVIHRRAMAIVICAPSEASGRNIWENTPENRMTFAGIQTAVFTQ